MYKEQNTTQEDILLTQTNANQPLKENSPLITHDAIKNTPFIITGNEERGYFLRLGDYRLTEYMQTKEDAAQALQKQQWDLILRCISIVTELHEKFKDVPKNKILD